MSNFFLKIKLKIGPEDYIFINPSHIEAFVNHNGNTAIFLQGDDSPWIVVESPETVQALCEEYLKNWAKIP